MATGGLATALNLTIISTMIGPIIVVAEGLF